MRSVADNGSVRRDMATAELCVRMSKQRRSLIPPVMVPEFSQGTKVNRGK
ncbi:hypothetical protein EDD29_4897 [Actinocorallia herbida]|uniref:Uncharacterized protein n=1 Tax=Actinocorallia herbida TaxID=58109 RepID=A0A3N1D1C9_9ACTN|nr:hypothetical protein EDD29_4897 [Actinocorallia herbida]